MNKIKMFMLAIFLWLIPIEEIHAYIQQMDKESFTINSMSVFKMDIDKNGNIYVVGYRNIKETRILILRKYDKNGTHLWSQVMDLWGHSLSIHDVKVVKALNMFCMCGAAHNLDDENSSVFFWYCVYDFEGNLKTKHYSLNDHKGTFRFPEVICADMDIDPTNGDIYIVLNDMLKERAIILKYTNGHINYYTIYRWHDCPTFPDCIKASGTGFFFVAGTTVNGFVFIAKYDSNGMLIAHNIYTYDFTTLVVDDIQLSQNHIYLLISPGIVICSYSKESGEADNCKPIIFAVLILNDLLKIHNQIVYTAEERSDNAMMYNPKMILTKNDIYVTGTILDDINVYTGDYDYKILMVAYSKHGIYRGKFLSKKYSNYSYATDIGQYIEENGLTLKDGTKISQQRIVVVFQTITNSHIQNFWVPKQISRTLNFNMGWNMFSIPLLPHRPVIAMKNLKQLKYIYRFDKFGYQTVLPSEELIPGRGYFGYASKATKIHFSGMEILGMEVIPINDCDMLGSASYPFFYSIPNQKDMHIMAYDFNENDYHITENKNLIPGNGYWVVFEKSLELFLSKIKIEVNE